MIDIFNKITDNIIIISTRGEIKFIDNRLLSKLGYENDEIRGNQLIYLLKDSDTYNKILKYKEDRTLEKFDFNIHSKSNEIINYNGILSLENYNDEEVIFIICNEIKEELYTKEDLENFIDTMPFMCAMKNLKGKYIFVNKLLLESFEEKKENVLGKYDKDIFSNDTCNKILSEENYTIKTKEFITTEKYIKKDNGFNRWCKIQKTPLMNEHGDVKFIGSISYDITLRKNIEKNLDNTFEKSLSLDKDNMIEDYARLDFIQSMLIKDLTADGSHEFKTPLNIILATMQLINKGIENKDITFSDSFDLKRYVGSIKQNSYRLLRLANNLIDMTRIDTGYYKINQQNANIVSIIEDITIFVAQYVEDKGISLIFDTEVEEEIIACDPDKIERIMLNLLSNAIKYTSSQGEIEVNLSINNNNVVVSVKDDGIGIPKEKLKTIFDRFEQVDNTLTRKCEGSGIGLSLVKSLIELHGGTIIAKSEEGKGSEFIFELPIKTIESTIEIPRSENTLNSKIEKCIIEFSDIYE